MVSAMMIAPRLAVSSDGDYQHGVSRPVGLSAENEEERKARGGHAQMGHGATIGGVERETHDDREKLRLSVWRGTDAGVG